MAEQPRYKRQAKLMSLPQVDFVQTGNTQARALQSVSSALDKMSAFSFNKVAEQQQKDAVQDVYQNPPSVEAINTAVKQNRSLDEIIGDPDTVFGAASRGAAGPVLRTEAEAQLRDMNASYLAKVNAGEPIDMEKMDKDFSAIRDGYSSALGAFDPEEAVAFRATAAVLANPIYKGALTNNLKIEAAARIAKADDAIEKAQDTIIGHFMTGDDAGAAAAAVSARQVDSSVLNTNNVDYIKQNSGVARALLEVGKREAVMALSMKEQEKDPISFAEKLSRGEMPTDYTQSLYDSLDVDAKADLRERLRKRLSETNKAYEDAAKAEELGMKEALNDARATVYNPASSDEEKKAAVAMMRDVGASGIPGYPPEVVEGMIANATDAASPRNPVGVSQVRMLIEKEELNDITDIDAYFGYYSITNPQDQLQIMQAVNADTKSDFATVRKLAVSAAKLIDETLATEEQASDVFAFESDVERKYSAEYEIWEGKGVLGGAPSRVQIAQQLSKAKAQSAYTQDIEIAIEDINKQLTDSNIAIKVYEYTKFEDIKEQLETSGMKKGRINGIEGQFKQIKDNLEKRGQAGF
jgi:hypothetical protein